MKNFFRFLILLFFVFSSSSVAQHAEFKEFAARMKASGAYYWGEGVSENQHEAEDQAMNELLGKIAVNVSSSFENVVKGVNDEYVENVKQVVRTYSTATLKNVDTRKDYFESKIYVLKFVKKTEVSKIFEERKKLCYSSFRDGVKYAEAGMFGDALKNFFFTIILMNSMPQQNIVYDSVNLKTEVPYRINKIIKGVKFQAVSVKQISKEEKVVSCNVFVNDKPASNLQFSFWDGNSYVDGAARDGKYDFYLVGAIANSSRLKIKIKYNYYESRDEFKEVNELWDLVNKPSFKNELVFDYGTPSVENNVAETPQANVEKVVSTDYNVSSTRDVAPVANAEILEKIKNSDLRITITNSCDIAPSKKTTILQNAIVFLTLLENRNMDYLSDFLHNDQFLIDKTRRLVRYNDIKILNKDIKVDLNKTAMGYEIRKVRVLNNYRSLDKRSSEYLILDFDEKGTVIDVNFAIMDNFYKEFFVEGKYGNDWGNRQVIVKFMEKYRTAYLTRDINVLDKIFAEDALIIVGRILKKRNKKSTDLVKYIRLNTNQPSYEQIRYTKREYLTRQRRIFNSRQDIFLDYSKFNIFRKNGRKGVYGITLRQNYLSTNYSDAGYLFLLIDFNKKHPQIYVRSWQPQEWDSTSLVELSNFRIND
jgi:hypothetical protein